MLLTLSFSFGIILYIVCIKKFHSISPPVLGINDRDTGSFSSIFRYRLPLGFIILLINCLVSEVEVILSASTTANVVTTEEIIMIKL